MAKQQAEDGGIKIVAVNRKATAGYLIVERFVAGIVLSGAEIKSIRQGEVNIAESFVRPQQGEIYLIQAHVKEYKFSDLKDYDPQRRRKLLMHKHEIQKLTAKVETKGLTIVPLKLYLKRGRAKLEIALGKGKTGPDRRLAIRTREMKREAERAMKQRKRD